MLKGCVNLFKPSGMTSNDAVCKVRGILRAAFDEKAKVGHLGTLDPLASGVLPVTIGSATKLFDYMQDKLKRYRATFVFGKTSDTLDLGSEVVDGAAANFDMKTLEGTLKKFEGDILQIPPQYSAKSIGGRRAYDIARSGGVADLKAKKVHIESIKALGQTERADEYEFEVICGSGTYIRALARDIAEALGTVGLMSSLVRIASGDFDINSAVTLEEFKNAPTNYIMPIERLLAGLDRYEIDAKYVDKILNGVMMELSLPKKSPFVVTYLGETVAIGESVDGKLHLKTRL